MRRRAVAMVAIALPTALATVYCGGIATPRYVSDAQFLARGANVSRFARQVPGLSFARSSDETQIVASSMRSHDLPDALQRQIDLKEMYRRPEADIVSRHPGVPGGQFGEFPASLPRPDERPCRRGKRHHRHPRLRLPRRRCACDRRGDDAQRRDAHQQDQRPRM